MKIDFHCHIFRGLNSKSQIEDQFNKKFSGYGFYERIKQGIAEIKTIETDDIIEKVLYHIKQARLDKVVLLPLSINENEKVLNWKRRAPEIFIPFFNPPERPMKGINTEKILKSAIEEDGIRGLKLMNPFREKHLNDPVLLEAFELAEIHELIVLMHTGYPPPGTRKNVLTYANPLKIEDIIQRFPELKIIIAHMGYPWVDVALSLAVQYPNIYVDISNLTYMMPKRLAKFLIRAKELIGTDKILFGSDGFVPEMIEMSVNYFEDIGFLSKNEIDKILGLNAKRLLHL
jgi:predicted TIM-barrel fold metal-dependent hydrolase